MADKKFRRQRIIYFVGILLAALLLVIVRAVLVPFGLALLLVYIVNPLIKAAEKHGFSRLWIVCFITIASLLLGGILFLYALPVISQKIEQFALNLPTILLRLERLFYEGQKEIEEMFQGHPLVSVLFQEIEVSAGAFLEKSIKGLAATVPHILSIFLVPFIAFHLLKDWSEIGKFLLANFPFLQQERFLQLGKELDCVVGGFIRGQFLASIFVGLLATVGLLIMKVDSPLLMGAFAGITNIIPYFGPIIGSLPPVISVLMTSPTRALLVLIFFIAIQQIESLLIAPYIFTTTLGLHPLVIVFSLLTGGYLFGFWGLLIAVPLAGASKIFWQNIREFS